MGLYMINKIPIGIKSCQQNNERKLAIEYTWIKTIDLDQFFPVFLVGRKDKPTELIENILYLDCHDSYQGLSGKMKEFYKWALKNTNASHFWSCDDDAYINTNIFNIFQDYKNYDYSGSFIYGIEKKENTLSGYTSGCGMCVSRGAAAVCEQYLPYIASDDDVSIGNIINTQISTIKKLHIETIHPWSYCQQISNLMIGHYIHKGAGSLDSFMDSMQKMHKYYI